MEAKAVRSFEFKQVRQFLSGLPVGYEKKDVWRVQIKIGNDSFTSSKTYTSEQAAKSAAKRRNDKHAEGETK